MSEKKKKKKQKENIKKIHTETWKKKQTKTLLFCIV